jgi:hypothetical protein
MNCIERVDFHMLVIANVWFFIMNPMTDTK